MPIRYSCALLVSCALLQLVAGLFEQCNHVIDLKAGQKIYINSPYYPHSYPVGTSCRYTVKAPLDYELDFKCSIQMNSPPAGMRCLNEVFYFNREGSELLSSSEYFCGSGAMERKSFLNRAVISYISTPVYKRNLPVATVKHNSSGKNKNNVVGEATITTAKTTAAVKVLTTQMGAGVNSPLTYENVEELRQNTSERSATTPMTTTDATTTAATLDMTTIATTTESETETEAETVTTPLVTSTSAEVGSTFPAVTCLNSSVHASARGDATTAASFSSTAATSSNKRPKIIVNYGASSGNTGNSIGGGVFSCLVEVVASPCECGWRTTTKVAGDDRFAGINEFPSMAGVQTVRRKQIFCGAVIIHRSYLLSAAHCFVAPETNRSELIRVVVGENDLSTVFESLYTRVYEIEAIILHDHFRNSANMVRNDIAILRTRLPMEWNRGVAPACLPFRQFTDRKPPIAGQRLDTAGWGTTTFGGPQSSRLQKTTLDVITTEQCKRSVHTLPSGTFCTYTPGRDTCQYDSGGALYARGEAHLFALGIVSYGYACATHQPSMNTKVASYLKWIRSQTPEVDYCIK